MKRITIVAAMLVASSFYTLAQAADMDCSHFNGMKSADQMATVESMHSSMSTGNEMNSTKSKTSSSGNMTSGAMSGDHMSTKEMTEKVAAACKSHPDMMVGAAMKGAMAH